MCPARRVRSGSSRRTRASSSRRCTSRRPRDFARARARLSSWLSPFLDFASRKSHHRHSASEPCSLPFLRDDHHDETGGAMLTEYSHTQIQSADRELQGLAQSRPRYDRPVADRRPRVRQLLRRLAFVPATANPGRSGRFPEVVIRPARPSDASAVQRLAEASERRLPSGVVLLAQVEDDVVAALPIDEQYVLTDLW